MAEDHEGPTPQEYIVKNPEALKSGVRERTRGVIGWFLDRNPVSREAARAMDRVNKALPEGRFKQIHRLGVDMVKTPMAIAGTGLELLKLWPPARLLAFIPEQISTLSAKAGGFWGEKIVESRPVRFALGSVENIMDKILGSDGSRETVVSREPVTLENAHQMLVGMARPETGGQERRKMT